MSRRRGGLWRRTLWGGSEGGGPPVDPAQLLLNEAAVRFDFSQYTDINDMVDVNGGWGPLALDFSGGEPTIALIAEGLEITGLATSPGFARYQLDVVPGPLSFDGDGLTYLSAWRILTPWSGASVTISNLTLGGDWANDGAPSLAAGWYVGDGVADYESLLLQDQGPGFGFIVDESNVTVTTDPATAGGVFVHVVTLDRAAEIVRSRQVSPDETSAVDVPFTQTPSYTDVPIDYFSEMIIGQGDVPDRVWIESLAWNRALTPAEVDTLIAHFTPVPDPAQLLLNEAAVRFDFSQYTDINDMVDVNGGWGPISSGLTTGDVEFTPDGMVVAAGVGLGHQVQGVGPLTFGPDGITMMQVFVMDEIPAVDTQSIQCSLACDANNAYAPATDVYWRPNSGSDEVDVYVWDPDEINTVLAIDAGIDSATPGVYVFAHVVDPVAQETRVFTTSPAGSFQTALPFDKPIPDFVAAPADVDALGVAAAGSAPAPGFIWDEEVAWNRALTPAEVDTLITHFTA